MKHRFLPITTCLCLTAAFGHMWLYPESYKKMGDPIEVLNIVAPYLPSNPVILEAGAYDGNETVAMLRHWPQATIHSFEPVPELYQKLLGRAKPFSSIHTYQMALGDRVGTTQFYVSSYANNPNMPSQSSSLLAPKEHLAYAPEVVFKRSITVPITTIDAWAKEHNVTHIDFMYLDMQGFELPALKASPEIFKTVKAVSTEIEFVEAYEGQCLYKDIKQWFEDQGFTMVASTTDIQRPNWFADALFVRTKAPATMAASEPSASQPKLPTGYVNEDIYICGDAFLKHFKHFIAGFSNYEVTQPNCSFAPKDVADGDMVLVNTPYLGYFFEKIHPEIAHNYILVSYGGDDSAPGKHARFLDDPKIISWFAVNNDVTNHPKLVPIPIGVANAVWPHGDKTIMNEVRERVAKGVITKNKLLYMNFTANTNMPLRSQVYSIFAHKSFCTKAQAKPFKDYCPEMAEYKYVISPHGNGLDCHRTWEALLVGCIPVVKTSTLDPLYQDLPVLIVNDWNEVTQELLEQRYPEMQAKKYNLDKVTIGYWINLIKQAQTDYRQNKLPQRYDKAIFAHKSAVTYVSNNGRLGDEILNYLHAKWVSYHYDIPLLYVPFKYSDQLKMHELEPFTLAEHQQEYTVKSYFSKPGDQLTIQPDAHILYVISYFPEAGTVAPHIYPYPYFAADWNDSGFKKEIQQFVRPRSTLQEIQPPLNQLSIAVHFRTGTGFDNDYDRATLSKKFTSDAFCIDNIKKISTWYSHQPIYAYIFTDEPNPVNILNRIKAGLSEYKNVALACRETDNHHSKNVLEDLFSMLNFDCIIRPESSYSLVASKIGNFKVVLSYITTDIQKMTSTNG